MGGPGVEVYLTPFMDNYTDSYGRPKASGPLDGDGRRSLYLNVRRNFLTPMLVAFDMPPPLVTAGRRDVSNVPAQALILMNDPFVVQQARRWAARVLASRGPRREQPGPSDVPGGLRPAAHRRPSGRRPCASSRATAASWASRPSDGTTTSGYGRTSPMSSSTSRNSSS